MAVFATHPPKRNNSNIQKTNFWGRHFFNPNSCSKLIWWVSTFAKVVVSTLPTFSNLIWCPTTFCKIHFPPCSNLKRWVLMICWCLFPPSLKSSQFFSWAWPISDFQHSLILDFFLSYDVIFFPLSTVQNQFDEFDLCKGLRKTTYRIINFRTGHLGK